MKPECNSFKYHKLFHRNDKIQAVLVILSLSVKIQTEVIELQSHQGWKRPPTSSSPTVHLPPKWPSKTIYDMNFAPQFFLNSTAGRGVK